jgi:PAS domain-containing protein
VGQARRLTRAALVFAAALAQVAGGATMATWVADGNCRDGRPQGPYALRTGEGRLRVAGAFNDGARTGSFIFWSDAGVRIAHLPFDHDLLNGTVAIWYEAPPGREPPRRFESAWRRGKRDGETRSWYRDGRPRALTQYAAGRITASAGWSDAGARMTDAAALEAAQQDAAALDALYAELDALVREHMPRCD